MKKTTLLSGFLLIITILSIAAVSLYVVLQQEHLKNTLYEPTDINNVVIMLQRGPCMGLCPVYNVTIFGNGMVVYHGIANVNMTGRWNITLSENQVRQVISLFRSIDYFSLNGTEIASHVVYDAPVCTTSLLINGKTKTIRHYETADPETLTVLENTIDAMVNSSQWIK